MVESDQIVRLEKAIGYTFSDRETLQLALRHRSLGARNNERLEFLGDSLLNCVIAEYLFQHFPKLKEGHMSRLRAGLVRGTTLSEIAREFNLGEFIQLGAGELKSGGFRRDSILADSVEAIIGAIYLDSDFVQCKTSVLSWFEGRLKSLPENGIPKDSKTRLQEFLQAHQLALPNYEVVSVEGEAHKQTFYVDCFVPSLPERTQGKGASRRIAEQEAARSALLALGLENE
ncbi:MAG: ribonuclease III [Gammaproteobacteria bacterium]|nr:MAG: ribonuclease III [Gammaproteobacteria bacterium]